MKSPLFLGLFRKKRSTLVTLKTFNYHLDTVNVSVLLYTDRRIMCFRLAYHPMLFRYAATKHRTIYVTGVSPNAEWSNVVRNDFSLCSRIKLCILHDIRERLTLVTFG